jgi:hypothetical protein
MRFCGSGSSCAGGFVVANSDPVAIIISVTACAIIHMASLPTSLRRLFSQSPHPLLALLATCGFDPLLSSLCFQQKLLLHGHRQLRQLLHCSFLPLATRFHRRMKPLE